MPRYFFHVHDGHMISDEEGTELPDLVAAKREAVRYAGALLADLAGEFWDGRDWYLEIMEDRKLMFILSFSAVVAPDRTA